MSVPSVTYRGYVSGDEHQLLELYNHVFSRNRTSKHWRWEYEENPIRRRDSTVAFQGPLPVGHTGGVPLEFSHDGCRVRTTRSQNGFVHPDVQGRGIYRELLAQFTEKLRADAIDFVFGFPNDNSLPSFMRRGEYEHPFDLFAYQCRIDACVGGALPHVTVQLASALELTPSDAAFLQRRLAGTAIVNPRDLEYLRWRYHPRSGHAYRIVRAFMEGRQIGLAVAKPYRAGRSLDLVEFVFEDGTGVRAVLTALAEAFRDEQAECFSVWSMEHYALHEYLRSIGFEREPRATHFVYKPLSSRCSSRCDKPQGYYLSMGDSDVY